MKRRSILLFALILVFVLLSSSRAGIPCVPGSFEERLRAHFTYTNRFSGPKTERFSVLKIGDVFFFKHNTPPDNYVPGLRPVYVLGDLKAFDILNCPDNATWVNYAAQWRSENNTPANEKTQTPAVTKELPCEFDLEVPEWSPGPENGQKREIAAELLKELTGHFSPVLFRTVYVHDFNLKDESIDFYYELDSGEEGVQGCEFDSSDRPYCLGWHLYGTVTMESVKEMIMEKPYRLYPAPIGKP